MPSYSFIGDEPLQKSYSNAKQPFILPDSKIDSSLAKQTVNADEKRLPLKDVSNSSKVSGNYNNEKAWSSDTSKNEHLLKEVKRQWRSGKFCHQTKACKAAIRECLNNKIARNNIASYVVSGMCEDLQVEERKRVMNCIKHMNKALKQKSTGEAAKEKSCDAEAEGPTAVSFHHQQSSVLSKTGGGLKTQKSVRFQALMFSPIKREGEINIIQDNIEFAQAAAILAFMEAPIEKEAERSNSIEKDESNKEGPAEIILDLESKMEAMALNTVSD